MKMLLLCKTEIFLKYFLFENNAMGGLTGCGGNKPGDSNGDKGRTAVTEQ